MVVTTIGDSFHPKLGRAILLLSQNGQETLSIKEAEKLSLELLDAIQQTKEYYERFNIDQSVVYRHHK